jgi:anaerobic magnesium-protoporphyrin IX monomethyl ester cyclase
MVVLIRPPAVDSVRFATTSIALPLGLAYIAAALERAGHEVRVLDAVGEAPDVRTRYYKGYLFGMRLEELAARVPATAEAIGISVTFTHEWPAAVRLIALLKRRLPRVPVICGGEHVTSMPELCLLTSAADYLVLGEGEETAVELVGALRAGRSVEGVLGTAYRDGAAIVVNPRRARNVDVDSLPWPAWHHFRLATYREYNLVGCEDTTSLTIPILATRGCPYQCTYCSAPNMWSPRWVARDPRRVADEIEHYVRTYGARNFPFQDLTAIIRKDWIVAFCKELIGRRLEVSWRLPSGTRAEAIDDEVAVLLKRSGMASMAYAPESGSETTRRYIKKKMHTEQLFASVRAAARAELYVMAFMVVGFPHDSPEVLAENVAFLRRMAAEGVTDMGISFYMALPGTELFHSLWDAGQIRLDRAYFRHILESLSFVPSRSYSPHLSRLDMARWKLRMFRAFYGARPRGGLVASVREAVRGLGGADHESRLQTAFRHGLRSLWVTGRAKLGPSWIPRREERRFFDGWTDLYAAVRRQKLAEGIVTPAPADPRELHRANVVPTLSRDHQRVRRHDIPLPAPV